MVSQTATFRKLLRQAQSTIQALQDAGRSTRALEIEFKRGEQAVAQERWDEAQEHLDRILAHRANGSSPPSSSGPSAADDNGGSRRAGDPDAMSDSLAVHKKLRLVRERVEALEQFGVEVEGIQSSLNRAEDFLDKSYVSNAESIADELLVMTKAQAEGLHQATSSTTARAAPEKSSPAAAGHAGPHDFIGALKGVLADMVKSQPWLSESQVRALIAENAPQVQKLLAAESQRHGGALEQMAKELRGELAKQFDGLRVQTQAGLGTLREEHATAMGEVSQEVAGWIQRLKDGAAQIEAQRDAIHHFEETLGAQTESLVAIESGLDEQRQLLSSRADVAVIGQLDEAVKDLRRELAGHPTTSEVTGLKAALVHDLEELRQQQQGSAEHLALALDQLTARLNQEFAHKSDATAVEQATQDLGRRLDASINEQSQVLIHLESGLDDLRQKLATKADSASIPDLSAKLEAAVTALRQREKDLAAKLEGKLAESLEKLSSRLNDGLAAKGDSAAVAHLAARLEQAMKTLHDGLSERVSVQAVAEMRTSLSNDLAALKKRQDEEAARLEARIAQHQQQLVKQLDEGLARKPDATMVDATAKEIDRHVEAAVGKHAQALAAMESQVKGQSQALQAKADGAALAALAAKFDAALATLYRDLTAKTAAAAEATGWKDTVAKQLASLQQSLADEKTQWNRHHDELVKQLSAEFQKGLGGKVDEARLTELRDRLQTMEASFQGKLAEAAKLMAKPLPELGPAISKLDQRLNSLEESSRAVPTLTQVENVTKHQAEGYSKLEKSLAALEEQVKPLRDELATRPKLAQIESSAKRQAEEHGKLEKSLVSLEKQLKQLQDELAARPKLESIESLTKQQAELKSAQDQKLAQVEKQLKQLQDELATRPKLESIESLTKQQAELKSAQDQKLAQVEKQLKGLDGKADEARLAELRDRLASMEVSLQGKLAETAKLMAKQIPELGPAISKLNLRLNSLEDSSRAFPTLTQVEDVTKHQAEGYSKLEKSLAALEEQVKPLRDELATRPKSAQVEALAKQQAELKSAQDQKLTQVEKQFKQLQDELAARPKLDAVENLIKQQGAVQGTQEKALAALRAQFQQMNDELALRPNLVQVESIAKDLAATRSAQEKGLATLKERLAKLDQEVSVRPVSSQIEALVMKGTPALGDKSLIELKERVARLGDDLAARTKQLNEVVAASAQIGPLATQMAGLRNLQGHLAEAERRLAGIDAIASRLQACETAVKSQSAAAAVGANVDVTSLTNKVTELLLRLIPESTDFRAVVAKEIQTAQSFSANQHGAAEDDETQRRAVSVLAARLDNAIKQFASRPDQAQIDHAIAALNKRIDLLATNPPSGAAPIVPEQLKSLADDLSVCKRGLADAATLAARLDDLESHLSSQTPLPGKPASVDIKAIRDQVVESIRPLLPRPDKIAEVINAAVRASVERAMAATGGGGGGGGGIDAKALRKMLPELLTTPEVRSTIITTVVIEALQGRGTLGDLTGIRSMIKEELKKIVMESSSYLPAGRPSTPVVSGPPGAASPPPTAPGSTSGAKKKLSPGSSVVQPFQ